MINVSVQNKGYLIVVFKLSFPQISIKFLTFWWKLQWLMVARFDTKHCAVFWTSMYLCTSLWPNSCKMCILWTINFF